MGPVFDARRKFFFFFKKKVFKMFEVLLSSFTVIDDKVLDFQKRKSVKNC